MKNDSKLSLKFNNIALRYVRLWSGTFPRSVAPSTEKLTTLENEINYAVAEEVLPVSVSYLKDIGFYQQIEEVGIEDPAILVNQIVNDIYNNVSIGNDRYINEVISETSLNFQNFVPDLKYLLENGTSSNIISEINNLKNAYLSQITDSVEALAIINGCETAKASFAYWSNSTNTNYWDNIVLNNFIPSISYSNKTVARAVSPRTRNEIIVADGVGAIVGVLEGARIRATVGDQGGPGGTMIVGMAGMILRGAHASARDYVKSKVMDWLGW